MSKAVGSGLYLERGGNICIGKKEGYGLYLTPGQLPNTYGDGLNLKHGGKFYQCK